MITAIRTCAGRVNLQKVWEYVEDNTQSDVRRRLALLLGIWSGSPLSFSLIHKLDNDPPDHDLGLG